MDEVKARQYCVAVEVWVVADNADHAEDIVREEIDWLISIDNPICGLRVKVGETEDKTDG